jgi:hypothetical protein
MQLRTLYLSAALHNALGPVAFVPGKSKITIYVILVVALVPKSESAQNVQEPGNKKT